jgi:prophage tail gpP-like protein
MFSLKIDGRKFDFFTNVNIVLDYNAIASSFSFEGLEDFTPPPLEYNDCQIIGENNEVLITGTVLNPQYAATNKPESVRVSGYSKPGVFEDCDIPVSLYPLQLDNLTLKQIVDKLLEPFEVNYIATANVQTEFNKVFKKTNSEPGQKIKDFINDLASQRGIILTHDNLGNLVFTKIEANLLPVVAEFDEGDPGIESMVLQVDAQAMHSEITVLRQADEESPNSGQFTIQNPYVPVFRPKTIVLNSGDINDVEKAARNELGAELRSIVVTIRTTKFVKAGQKIKVRGASIKLNVYTEFFVETTVITATNNAVRYDLTCVPIDVFTQSKVQNIFERQVYQEIPRF